MEHLGFRAALGLARDRRIFSVLVSYSGLRPSTGILPKGVGGSVTAKEPSRIHCLQLYPLVPPTQWNSAEHATTDQDGVRLRETEHFGRDVRGRSDGHDAIEAASGPNLCDCYRAVIHTNAEVEYLKLGTRKDWIYEVVRGIEHR